MTAAKDISGQHFGMLEAVTPTSQRVNGVTKWFCLCDCGNQSYVSASKLITRSTASCGCLRSAKASIKASGLTHKRRPNFKHGYSGTRAYNSWVGMIQRCLNPNDKNFSEYGGRGITVCKEWRDSFASFRQWALSHGWENGLTIDRIDNDKDYSPSNCRMATREEQSRNKRNNVLCADDVPYIRIMHNEGDSPHDIARKFGVNVAPIRQVISNRTWANA